MRGRARAKKTKSRHSIPNEINRVLLKSAQHPESGAPQIVGLNTGDLKTYAANVEEFGVFLMNDYHLILHVFAFRFLVSSVCHKTVIWHESISVHEALLKRSLECG